MAKVLMICVLVCLLQQSIPMCWKHVEFTRFINKMDSPVQIALYLYKSGWEKEPHTVEAGASIDFNRSPNVEPYTGGPIWGARITSEKLNTQYEVSPPIDAKCYGERHEYVIEETNDYPGQLKVVKKDIGPVDHGLDNSGCASTCY